MTSCGLSQTLAGAAKIAHFTPKNLLSQSPYANVGATVSLNSASERADSS